MIEHLRRLITENNLVNSLVNSIIIIFALFLSYEGVSAILNHNVDLNSNLPLFLYTTLATVVSSILDPILELLNVEPKKKKLIAILFGIMVSILTFCYSFYDNSIFANLLSISKRGGFSAISLALLLFSLVYINYQLQKVREEKLNEDKQKRIEEKQKVIATIKENEDLKKENENLRKRCIAYIDNKGKNK